MGNQTSSRKGLIAAGRRRRILSLALEQGSINVTAVAKELGVNRETVRRDLAELDKEGKLIRSYGGATVREAEINRPYSILRNENLQQKAWIGQAAVNYLPNDLSDSGLIWIGAGSSAYQFAMNMPEKWPGEVITGSPEIAVYLASAKGISVGLMGGKIRMDAFSTDCSWSENVLNIANWDVTFMSVHSIDIEHGMSGIDISAALSDSRIVTHGKKLVILCDSSKFGKFSRAIVGPVDLIDVLITDIGVNPKMVDELTSRGIEVVVAGPDGARRG